MNSKTKINGENIEVEKEKEYFQKECIYNLLQFLYSIYVNN